MIEPIVLWKVYPIDSEIYVPFAAEDMAANTFVTLERVYVIPYKPGQKCDGILIYPAVKGEQAIVGFPRLPFQPEGISYRVDERDVMVVWGARKGPVDDIGKRLESDHAL